MFIFINSNLEPKFGFCALYFGETSKNSYDRFTHRQTDRCYCDSLREVQEKQSLN